MKMMIDGERLRKDIEFKLLNDPVSGDGRNKLKWVIHRIEELERDDENESSGSVRGITGSM